ncbi:hypothetical protein M2139_001937 [Enterococcus sp. PF1-24]|uniref:hypothetical protein n=1 Tax=unclassified Enterococcus TaxID=2608891 RepID=UPI0024766A4F|nr:MULTISPECIES: hypothetical protein [unclassified Enterococcus]MDH6364936.1 hypothetical protein [Enterococcus sp. PFB1-1]MDH6402037.1 hypothetical protein [Enterococcus sp. PF1-24]
MQKSEKFNDWLLRYQYIYAIRRSDKSKQRFLSAIIKDILEYRDDIQVIAFNEQKKTASRNIYVGNIEQADRIICTYYDTPPKNFGPYNLFNSKEQGKKTLLFILTTTILMILLGLLGTFAYMKNVSSAFDLSSFTTWLFIGLFAGYFFLLGKVSQGLSNRQTLIRNTSSILTLLLLLKDKQNPKTAFAFIDEGSYGEQGLAVLKSSCKKQAKIFCLDSVGSQATLTVSGNDFKPQQLANLGVQQVAAQSEINYIFSGRQTADSQPAFYLTKADLKQKTLNFENLEKVISLFN